MKTITHTQLLNILEQSKGAFPVGVDAHIDARARKTGNPFPDATVYKDVSCVGFVGADYGKAVVRQGEREGVDASDFTPQPLPWGEWLVRNKVIQHKGALYLRMQTTPGQRDAQPATVHSYRDNAGHYLSPDMVKPFLPAPRAVSHTQEAVGLTEGVDVRTFKFENISRVRIGGEQFALVPDNAVIPKYHAPFTFNDGNVTLAYLLRLLGLGV